MWRRIRLERTQPLAMAEVALREDLEAALARGGSLVERVAIKAPEKVLAVWRGAATLGGSAGRSLQADAADACFGFLAHPFPGVCEAACWRE